MPLLSAQEESCSSIRIKCIILYMYFVKVNREKQKDRMSQVRNTGDSSIRETSLRGDAGVRCFSFSVLISHFTCELD